jgi:putative NADH-flavin reductase
MVIAIIGASGFVGRALVKQSLKANHQVITISRSGIFEPHEHLKNVHVDVFQEAELAEALKPAELIVSAYNSGWNNPNLYQEFIDGSKHIMSVCKQLHKHVVFIGGASSLLLPNGEPALTTISNEWKEKVRGAFDLLSILRKDLSFDWTFISPAAEIIPSDDHFDYNIGGDYMLYNKEGKSQITVADLALFAITEAARREHIHKRLTLARR